MGAHGAVRGHDVDGARIRDERGEHGRLPGEAPALRALVEREADERSANRSYDDAVPRHRGARGHLASELHLPGRLAREVQAQEPAGLVAHQHPVFQGDERRPGGGIGGEGEELVGGLPAGGHQRRHGEL